MSRTLFLYIFKDLFKIFVMASGALAGIMSFGGLLRPLTREGLDAGQVTRMLTYFGPAMTTYSFPVAALFATAVVYGRLAADNELTACKAGGISLLSLTVSGPALVLGLVVAITSLLFLCFVVPISTLRVERVIYSNLAKLVQSRIERTHEIEFEETTIFAQEAHVMPPEKGQQLVELIAPAIISVEHDPNDKTLLTPKEFYTASRAWLYIEPLPDGQEVKVLVTLTGGFKFPRRYTDATEAGVATTIYGPFPIPSPIKEDVKFMNVWQLKELYADLSKSRKLQAIIADFVKSGQRSSFLDDVYHDLNGPARLAVFKFETGNYSLALKENAYVGHTTNEVLAVIRTPAATQPAPATAPTLEAELAARPIEFTDEKDGVVVRAASVGVRAQPNNEEKTVQVTVVLKDCMQRRGNSDEYDNRAKYEQSFSVPMSAKAQAIAGRDIAYYENNPRSPGEGARFVHDKTALINNIIAESNGRASFAISCLILVMVGSALGMMFRSGNFLTAFAVSFIPALMSITLIIAGQRTAGNVPFHFDGTNNPLKLGLILIWSGNAVNLLLALGLLWKLGRR